MGSFGRNSNDDGREGTKHTMKLIIILCVAVALAKAKPQDNAYFKGSNTNSQDLVGVQNSGSGSKPIHDAEESDLNPGSGLQRRINPLSIFFGSFNTGR